MKASKRKAKRNKKNALVIGGVTAAAVSAVAGAGFGVYSYTKKKSPKVTDTLSDVTTDGE